MQRTINVGDAVHVHLIDGDWNGYVKGLVVVDRRNNQIIWTGTERPRWKHHVTSYYVSQYERYSRATDFQIHPREVFPTLLTFEGPCCIRCGGIVR